MAARSVQLFDACGRYVCGECLPSPQERCTDTNEEVKGKPDEIPGGGQPMMAMKGREGQRGQELEMEVWAGGLLCPGVVVEVQNWNVGHDHADVPEYSTSHARTCVGGDESHGCSDDHSRLWA